MADVPAGEYIVFEHGPFDYEQENRSVEEKMEKAMAAFDFTGTSYCFDTSPGRMIYFYFNPEQFWKYIRPVRRGCKTGAAVNLLSKSVFKRRKAFSEQYFTPFLR